nr:zinc-binding dehydrogenase [Angustibacter aerolatus]
MTLQMKAVAFGGIDQAPAVRRRGARTRARRGGDRRPRRRREPHRLQGDRRLPGPGRVATAAAHRLRGRGRRGRRRRRRRARDRAGVGGRRGRGVPRDRRVQRAAERAGARRVPQAGAARLARGRQPVPGRGDRGRRAAGRAGRARADRRGARRVGFGRRRAAALLRDAGVRAVATASARGAEVVRRFGGEPIEYGDGLEQRLRDAAPDGYDAAYDCVGTDEALDTSLALVPRDRLVTIAAFQRAQDEGFVVVGGTMPESRAFRDEVRLRLLEAAGRGEIVVPVARTFPLRDAQDALRLLADGHPGGKAALIP